MTALSRTTQRFLLGLGMMAACASSVALPAYTGGLSRYNFQGTSLGLAIGVKDVGFDPTITSTAVSVTASSTITKKNQMAFQGGIDLGYSWSYESGFYVGGDLGFQMTSTPGTMVGSTTSTATSSVTTTLNVRNAGNMFITGDVLLGYRVSDKTLLYVRLGTGYNNGKITTSGTGVTATAKTHSLILARAGLGMKYALAQNANITLSYVYTHAPSMSQAVTIDDSTNAAYAATVKEQSHWNGIMLGIELQCSSIAC